MEILGIPINHEQDGLKHTWSFELFGSTYTKIAEQGKPGDLSNYNKKQIVERITMTIRKAIVDTLYVQDKRTNSGKYFVTFPNKDSVKTPNMIETIFCTSPYQPDGNISFYTDNEIVTKLC